MQCCQMFHKTFREGNFKFKFNVNKDHKWNFQLNFQRKWCLNVEIRHNKIQISLILPKNREVKIFKNNLSKNETKKIGKGFTRNFGVTKMQRKCQNRLIEKKKTSIYNNHNLNNYFLRQKLLHPDEFLGQNLKS